MFRLQNNVITFRALFRFHVIPFVVFQTKTKDVHENLKKIIVVSKGNQRFQRESLDFGSLKSGTLNCWEMEGAQKETFSVCILPLLANTLSEPTVPREGVIWRDVEPV